MWTVSKTCESMQASTIWQIQIKMVGELVFSDKNSEASISKFSYFFMILVSAGSNFFFCLFISPLFLRTDQGLIYHH